MVVFGAQSRVTGETEPSSEIQLGATNIVALHRIIKNVFCLQQDGCLDAMLNAESDDVSPPEESITSSRRSSRGERRQQCAQHRTNLTTFLQQFTISNTLIHRVKG